MAAAPESTPIVRRSDWPKEFKCGAARFSGGSFPSGSEADPSSTQNAVMKRPSIARLSTPGTAVCSGSAAFASSASTPLPPFLPPAFAQQLATVRPALWQCEHTWALPPPFPLPLPLPPRPFPFPRPAPPPPRQSLALCPVLPHVQQTVLGLAPLPPFPPLLKAPMSMGMCRDACARRMFTISSRKSGQSCKRSDCIRRRCFSGPYVSCLRTIPILMGSLIFSFESFSKRAKRRSKGSSLPCRSPSNDQLKSSSIWPAKRVFAFGS